MTIRWHFNVTMHSFYTAVHLEASLLLGTPDGDAWVTHVRFAQSLAFAWNKALFQKSKPTRRKGNGKFRPAFRLLHVITSVKQRERTESKYPAFSLTHFVLKFKWHYIKLNRVDKFNKKIILNLKNSHLIIWHVFAIYSRLNIQFYSCTFSLLYTII